MTTNPPTNFDRSWFEHTLSLVSDRSERRKVAITSSLVVETFRFFTDRGLLPLAVPVTTGSVSSPMGLGSDSLPVEVELNGRKTFLADSMQFALELGVRLLGTGAFYVAPSFRGEPLDSFHLQEFQHAEAEITGGLEDVINLASDYVSTLTRKITASPEWQETNAATSNSKRTEIERIATGSPIPRINHADAIARLQSDAGATRELVGAPGVRTITRRGESMLCRDFGGAVWLTHLPTLACPFYQKPNPSDPTSCLSADLLMGGHEVLGAGERCASNEETLTSLARHGVDPSAYGWYLAMKQAAPARTAGFGLGVERYLMWLLGIEDIRNCTPWIRQINSVGHP